MTIVDVWAQLEDDLKWRQDEIRLFSNASAALRKSWEKDRIRRAQLVMLYAHLEGFSKVAFSTYNVTH